MPLDAGLRYGGAEVIVEMTAHELRGLGVDVEVLTPYTRGLGDIVHAFGVYPPYLAIQNMCRQQQVPFVLTPIYLGGLSPWGVLHERIRARRRNHPVWHARKLIAGAVRVLPNTRFEAAQVRRIFACDPTSVIVVPDGVEERFAHADPRLFRERTGIRGPFVLNVARLESRKNQLRLIQALRGSGRHLVLFGKPMDQEYLAACREAGGDAVTFLPPAGHDDPLLASAYAAAHVFALPSLIETPGISAMEAGIAGARIVTTPIGGGDEYFGPDAWYVKPESVDSIRAALDGAWEAPPSTALRERLLRDYTWRAVAQQTLGVYRDVLAATA